MFPLRQALPLGPLLDVFYPDILSPDTEIASMKRTCDTPSWRLVELPYPLSPSSDDGVITKSEVESVLIAHMARLDAWSAFHV